MGNVILPALIPDITRIYDVYFNASEAEPMAKLMLEILFPGGITEEFRKGHTEHTLKYWHDSSLQHTIKCVDSETGEIIGMGLHDTHFLERSEEERKNPGISWLDGEYKARAEKILNPLWEAKEKMLGGRRHIYCHVIAVEPKYQGRKAGAALVQWGIDVGEQSSLPYYLESSPSAAGLYTKMGFETLKEKIVHKAEVLGTETDIEVPLMVKMPSAAKGMTFDEWREKGYPAWETKEKIVQKAEP